MRVRVSVETRDSMHSSCIVADALAGVRVLDFSRLVAGGIAGMLLADFGADVVKVELPGAGDPLRQWTAGGQPFWWNVYARNKRLVTLNLKQPEGRDLLRRLCRAST